MIYTNGSSYRIKWLKCEIQLNIIPVQIQNLVYAMRGQQIMLDSDLAMLYQVETKRLNEAVKRNIMRFPEDFCFQLTDEEYLALRSQFAYSKEDDCTLCRTIKKLESACNEVRAQTGKQKYNANVVGDFNLLKRKVF